VVLGISLIGITLRLLELSFSRSLQTLRTPAIGALLMTISVYGVLHLPVPLPDLARLLLAILVGAVVYIGVSAWLDREFLRRSLRLLLGLDSKGKSALPQPALEEPREP
jgi:hypothetical protein